MKKSLAGNSSFLLEKLTDLKYIIPLLLITCFLAYGLSLDMYFWKDDFALMIKAQHPEEPVGFFGPGIKGDGAYRYITVPFAILYPYFELNAFAYFFVGILLYFFSAIGVFILAQEIFHDRLKAFSVSLIYSCGFIGADSIFGLTNSYQTSWVILFLTLALTFFIRSFRIWDLGLYILSIFIFAMALETGYIRAHGFFLIIFSSAVLIIDKLSIEKVANFLIKVFPFFLIFKSFYLNTTPAQVGSFAFLRSLDSRNYDYFLNPLITFINVIVPTPLIELSSELIGNLIGRDVSTVKMNIAWFFVFLITLAYLLILFFIKGKLSFRFPRSQYDLKVIFFGLSSIFGSFAGVFFIGAASTYLQSTHRYLSSALIGLAFFWVSVFSLILPKTKYKILIPIMAVCLLYLVLGNLYALENINSRTKPQKEFFSQLKKELPEIKGKTFLYFDVSNKNNSQGKFGNIFGAGSVGGSPEITMHYAGVDRYDVLMSIADFKDFSKKIIENNGSIDKIYAFYFEDNKLINKTDEFREVLKKGKNTPINFLENISHKVSIEKKGGKSFLVNTAFELNIPSKIFTLTDGVLKFNLEIITDPSPIQNEEKLTLEEQKILKYLISKNRVKKNSKAFAFNHFQNQTEDNLLDGKTETTWMADRGPWHNIINNVTDQIQFIDISLTEPITLGGVLFTNGHTLRTPTMYKIFVREGSGWREVKKTQLEVNKSTNEIWFDKLDPTFTDSVKIEILKSESGDAPQIAELELVESQFSGVDFSKALKIEIDPSILLEKNPNSILIRNYFEQNGKISFSYLSNKDNDYNVPLVTFNIKGFNTAYSYEIPVAGNGTNLDKIKFSNLNFPAIYKFSNFEFITPGLNQLTTK